MATSETITDCPKCSGTGPFHCSYTCPVLRGELDALPRPVMATRASMLADLEGAPSEDGYVNDEDGCYGDEA